MGVFQRFCRTILPLFQFTYKIVLDKDYRSKKQLVKNLPQNFGKKVFFATLGMLTTSDEQTINTK